MRKFLIILTFTIFTTLVFCDQNEQSNSVNQKSNEVQQNQNFDSNQNSIKTKRGIHGFAGLRYLPPAPAYSGLNYFRHTPYHNFPGRFYTRPAGPSYTLAPGNAVVHSYNANFPRVIYPRPVLRPSIPAPLPPPVFIQPKPIVPSVPVYTHRYPVFVPRPIAPLPPVTQFSVPNFVPSFPSPHFHAAHPVPVPAPVPLPFHGGVVQPSTIISQNGWKPLYSSIPSIPSPQPAPAAPFIPAHSHLNLASSSHPQRPSNYYLPADPLPAHDVHAHAHAHAHSAHNELSHENGKQRLIFNVSRNARLGSKAPLNPFFSNKIMYFNWTFFRALSSTKWSAITLTTVATNPRNPTSWQFLAQWKRWCCPSVVRARFVKNHSCQSCSNIESHHEKTNITCVQVHHLVQLNELSNSNFTSKLSLAIHVTLQLDLKLRSFTSNNA